MARLQRAFTESFHIVIPAIGIGVASVLAVLEWRRRHAYHSIFQFWSKIFAVGYGAGVVFGAVMIYEFDTNWCGFSRANASFPFHLAHMTIAAFIVRLNGPLASLDMRLRATRRNVRGHDPVSR
nr:cytochrome ubiquinol oxidase subunit I [Burkholderia ubonensis]